ncbi:MAG TPA: helix-turn-helix domain-containing protein [Candidatus Solibacter sp.]|nr:helix-turn-helix domain-containing protein [Candidatus Solibacter sp.]
MAAQPSFALLSSTASAAAVLHPLRQRILESLAEPDSAAGVARRLRLPRQRLNYHVRELARAGLLRRAGRRRKRNMYEQCYVATARGYALSPELLGRLGADPRRVEDTFSAAYLLALAAQLQAELGRASREATAQGKRLTTLSMNSEFRFESAGQRAEFARALEAAVVDVIGRFASPAQRADGAAGAGRPYRLVVGCYPVPPGGAPEESKVERKKP